MPPPLLVDLRRIDLDHVQSGLPPPDPAATLTFPAGLPVVPSVGTVQSHGQDPGQSRLPDPSRSAKKIGMADPVPGDGSPKCFGHMFLGGDLRKTPGPVLSS